MNFYLSSQFFGGGSDFDALIYRYTFVKEILFVKHFPSGDVWEEGRPTGQVRFHCLLIGSGVRYICVE